MAVVFPSVRASLVELRGKEERARREVGEVEKEVTRLQVLSLLVFTLLQVLSLLVVLGAQVQLYIYVCIYIYIYVCMYVCMYI